MANRFSLRRSEDEQMVKMWTPYHITITADYPFLRRGRFFSLCSRWLCRFALAVLSGYNRLLFGLRVEGTENLKKAPGGAVTICNHVHMLDCSMVNIAYGKKMYFPTLKSNVEIPFVRFLVRLLGGIPIPETPQAFAAFSKAIKQLLKGGGTVHLYPEGMLYPYCGQIRPFHRGAFMYAYDCGVPVIPFAVTYRPAEGLRGRLKKRPFLTLTILEPIFPDPSASRRGEIERMREEAFRRMKEHCEASETKALASSEEEKIPAGAAK